MASKANERRENRKALAGHFAERTEEPEEQAVEQIVIKTIVVKIGEGDKANKMKSKERDVKRTHNKTKCKFQGKTRLSMH